LKFSPKNPLPWLRRWAKGRSSPASEATKNGGPTSAQDAFSVPFPLEFAIAQTPVSAQASNTRAKEAWKTAIGHKAQARINQVREQYFLDERPLMATIFYFPPSRMAGDIDNIVKPILDGMVRIAYLDDHCIERVVVQKFEPGVAWLFASPTETLESAIQMEKPALYVRLEDDLTWRSAS